MADSAPSKLVQERRKVKKRRLFGDSQLDPQFLEVVRKVDSLERPVDCSAHQHDSLHGQPQPPWITLPASCCKSSPLQPWYHTDLLSESKGLDWAALGPGADPTSGGLQGVAAQRKRWQIENLSAAFDFVISGLSERCSAKLSVVEFCGGSGYFAMPMAVRYPEVQFVVVDMKEMSLDIARSRVEAAGLSNVRLVHGLVQDFHEPFDVGVALHACGEATDLSLDKCLEARAAYVMCPCCVGKAKHSALPYPRSQCLRDLLSQTEYLRLAKAGDFGHRELQAYTGTQHSRRACKSYLERDRNLRMEEAGYHTYLCLMQPTNATPKNDILIGLPG